MKLKTLMTSAAIASMLAASAATAGDISDAGTTDDDPYAMVPVVPAAGSANAGLIAGAIAGTAAVVAIASASGDGSSSGSTGSTGFIKR